MYVYGKTVAPAVRAQREANQWRTRATVAEARVTELEQARQAAIVHAENLARRVESLEREVKGVRDQNMGLRAHNTTLRARTLGDTTLWPGDTPEVCAARLQAAADEAHPAPRALRTHCKRGHELTEDNIYQRSDAKRQCRTCKADADRARTARAVPVLKAAA